MLLEATISVQYVMNLIFLILGDAESAE